MRNITQRIRSDVFLRHNAIFFFGSIAVAVLNYLYHPVISRLLSLQDFGEVQTIFSISVQVGIILNILGLVAVNALTNREHSPERAELVADLQSVSLYVLTFISIILTVLSGALARIFQFDSAFPFFVLILILLTSVPLTFRRSYLQAVHDFAGASIANIITALLRLIAATSLVIVGLHSSGALLGLVVAQIATLWYLYAKTRGERSLSLSWRLHVTPLLLRELRYIALTLVSVFFVSFLTTADIIFAKYFFDPATAGSYSGVSTVGRIVFYATSSIAAVLMPSVRLDHTFAEHTRILLKALALLLAIGISALVIFILFPSLILKILLGSKFLTYTSLLPRLSVVTLFASIINLLMYYFLALRRYELLGIIAIGTLATCLPLSARHQAPADLVNAFVWGSSVTLLVLLAFLVYTWYSHNFSQNHA